MLRQRRGQSTLEYALVIAAVIAALIAINSYMKKGVEGRLKSSTDQIGKQFEANGTFSDSWSVNSTGTTTTTETRVAGGGTGTVVSSSEILTRGENSTWGTQ
ncbi:MAG: hypothetical protein ABIH27_01560 [Candidatus Omnitrophota bacterium]